MMEMKPSYGPLVCLPFSIGILDCLFFFPVKWFLEWYLSNFYRFCFSFLSTLCGSNKEAAWFEVMSFGKWRKSSICI